MIHYRTCPGINSCKCNFSIDLSKAPSTSTQCKNTRVLEASQVGFECLLYDYDLSTINPKVEIVTLHKLLPLQNHLKVFTTRTR
jgi:hypothetical protein